MSREAARGKKTETENEVTKTTDGTQKGNELAQGA